MAQTIETKYSLDLNDFFAQMDKMSATLGQVEDRLKAQSRLNPLGEAASKLVDFNKHLSQQVQTYQRVQAAVVSLEKEQARLKQTTAQIKKSQDELAAADQYGELKKQISLIERALERLSAPLKEVDSWWDKLKAKFAKGLSVPTIKLPSLGGKSSGDQKDGFLGQAGEAALDQLGEAAGLNLSGGTLAAGTAVAATAGTVIKGTKEWAAYGAALSEVSALTGATGKSLEYLDTQAQKIERETGLAGKEVLEAFKSIAGIKPELLENNEALAQTTKEVITLSQASKLSLEESAKALLGSLSQFGEGAEEAARFSNVLAAGAKLGNSEINDTAEALKNSGTAMKAAGLSFEQGNALLQILAGKMIKGSEAGTALRNVLLKLETDTDKNLRPSIVGLNAALDNAAKKYDTTSEQAKIFGTENIVAAKQVLDARNEVAKMTETLTGTNVAYEQARTNTDNLASDLKKAGTSIDAFFRNLGQSNDGFLRGMVQRFTSFVNEIGSKTSVFKTFISSYVNNEQDGLIGALFTAGRAANKQRQANLDASRNEAKQSGIVTATKQSVDDDLRIITELNKKRGEVQAKAERDAADTVKKQRDAVYAEAVADHQRLRKELEAEIKQTGKDSGKLAESFNKSREALLSASTGKKLADNQVARLKKQADEQAANLAKLLNEGPSKEGEKARKKALDDENESNRLLLAAKQDYLKEVQKLESDYGKERLEQLQKDSAGYIDARADLDQKELKLQRDQIEKKLQLAKSDKTLVINGKRQVVADTNITLANSAPQIAAIFADREKQIEEKRARDLQLSRIRQEYQLLELAKRSNETELQLFDKFWEEKLLLEKKNTETYDSLLKQRDDARAILAKTGTVQEIAEFEKAWELILANEKTNTAVYEAMVAKRNRDRNTLAVDLILKQTKDQEGIELAFTSTDQFSKNLRANDPSLNADDILEKRQQAQLAIRIKYGQETIRLLREQGEAQNALLISQTQAAVDELKQQQDELKANTPAFRDIYDLLGLTDGMDQTHLDYFRKGMQQIGDAITEVTSLIVQQSEERIQAIDREIDAKQQQVDIETERNQQGYANNLALRQKELDDLKAQKAQEEQVRRNALKVQQALDTASTISNAAMTVSNGITFLTRLAAEEIKLGPIAGPIAFFGTLAAMTAAIFASVAKIRALSSASTQLRKGGRLRGPSHEAGGIRGTGAFSDIEVEGNEHITNARSSIKYDRTLEALNVDDPHKAIAAMMREGGLGLPPVIIQHMQSPSWGVQKQSIDLTSLTSELREHKELTRAMFRHMQNQGKKKQITSIAPGFVVEQEDGKTTYKDMRSEMKRLGYKVD
ncbi:phage tail tape measure protein [Spirosoma koreense]